MLCFSRYYDSHPLLPAPSPFMPPLGFQQRQRTSFAAPVAGPDTFYSNRAYSFSHFEFLHSSHPPLRICNTHASVMYASGNSQGAQSCRSMHKLVPPRHCSKCQSAAICTVPATAQSQRHHRQLREVRAQQRDERRGEQRTAGAALDAVGSTLHAGGTARTNRVQLQRFVLTEGAARKASHMHGATVWAAGALCRPQTVQHAAALGSRSGECDRIRRCGELALLEQAGVYLGTPHLPASCRRLCSTSCSRAGALLASERPAPAAGCTTGGSIGGFSPGGERAGSVVLQCMQFSCLV